jgi:hypothetical protein
MGDQLEVLTMYSDTNNNNRNFACLKLSSVEDCKEIIRQVLVEIWDEGTVVASAGRICNLLQVWLKAHETAEIEDVEERLAALEKDRKEAKQ